MNFVPSQIFPFTPVHNKEHIYSSNKEENVIKYEQ